MADQESNAEDPVTRVPTFHELEGGIDRESVDACTSWLEKATSLDAVHALARLSDDQRIRLLGLLPSEAAADVIEQIPEQQAVEALEGIDAAKAAGILEQLPSDEKADFVGAMDDIEADAILSEWNEDVAEGVRALAAYDDEQAGGLMVTEFLSFSIDSTVRDVLADLEENAHRYEDYDIQYSYVVGVENRLLGVLPMRRLLLAKRTTPLRDLMIESPISISDHTPLDEVAAVFRVHPFIGLPVTGDGGVLVGVVERSGIEQALAVEAESVYRQSQGIVGGEELRSMPLALRSGRRLGWLSINIVLNIVAASIIALHQDTLEAVIALAVFLPIISDMSGCSGNQAVAVSMRELTLGVTRPQDILRVLAKECTVGLLNGIALGILIGGVAFLWKGNLVLGAVIAVAMMINTVLSVCIGGVVPLVLKGRKLDPALASGPILTTITDMAGFLLVLSLASAVMEHLAI